MNTRKWLWFCGAPVVLGVVTLLIAGKISFLNSIYNATSSDSTWTRMGASIGVSLLNMAFIGLPLFITYIKNSKSDSSRTIGFWGFTAGLAYGFVPIVKTLLDSEGNAGSSSNFLTSSSQPLLMLLMTTILMGFLGGLLGYCISFAAHNKQSTFGHTAAGILATSALGGLTMAFSGSLIGWVVPIFTALMFVAHVRNEVAHNPRDCQS